MQMSGSVGRGGEEARRERRKRRKRKEKIVLVKTINKKNPNRRSERCRTLALRGKSASLSVVVAKVFHLTEVS